MGGVTGTPPKLQTACESLDLSRMEIQLTPEQEARLSQIAQHDGTNANQLVTNAALRLVEEDERFR